MEKIIIELKIFIMRIDFIFYEFQIEKEYEYE